MTDYSTLLPKMLFGKELEKALTILPVYSENVRQMETAERLLRLSDIYKIFIPNEMAAEIYCKLYSMASISLQKKGTIESVRLLNAVHHGIVEPYNEDGFQNDQYKGRKSS